jgi:hypothetical protein
MRRPCLSGPSHWEYSRLPRRTPAIVHSEGRRCPHLLVDRRCWEVLRSAACRLVHGPILHYLQATSPGPG